MSRRRAQSCSGYQDSDSDDDDQIPVKRVRKIDLSDKIADMMYILGDDIEPERDSVKLMCSILRDQMNILLIEAERNMMVCRRESDDITHEDVIFILRKNKAKLKRLMEYLRVLDMQNLTRTNNEMDSLKGEGKRVRMCLDFLAKIEDIDEFTSLLYDEKVFDPVFKRQLERRELRTNAMSLEEYKDFTEKSATAALYVEKKGKRFKDWLLQDDATECNLTPLAVSVLYFIARETIAQIVDHALVQKVRRYEQMFPQNSPMYVIDSLDNCFDQSSSAFREFIKNYNRCDITDDAVKRAGGIVENTSHAHQFENVRNKPSFQQYRDPSCRSKIFPQNVNTSSLEQYRDQSSSPEILPMKAGSDQGQSAFRQQADPSSLPKNDSITNEKGTAASIFKPERIKITLNYMPGTSFAFRDSLSNLESANVLVDEDSNIENKSNSDSNSMENVLDMVFGVADKTKVKESDVMDTFPYSLDFDHNMAYGTENDNIKHENEKGTQTEHLEIPLIHSYAGYATRNDFKCATPTESFVPPEDHDYIHTALGPGDKDASIDKDNVAGNVRDLQNPFYGTAASGGNNTAEGPCEYVAEKYETNWQFEPITDVSDAEVSDAKDAQSEGGKSASNNQANDSPRNFQERFMSIGYAPSVEPMSDDGTETSDRDSEYDFMDMAAEESGLFDPISREEIWNAFEFFQKPMKPTFNLYGKRAPRRTKLICLNHKPF